MQLSARNQLNATVESVTLGEVMSTVKVALPDGQHVTAAITKDAAQDLAFAARRRRHRRHQVDRGHAGQGVSRCGVRWAGMEPCPCARNRDDGWRVQGITATSEADGHGSGLLLRRWRWVKG